MELLPHLQQKDRELRQSRKEALAALMEEFYNTDHQSSGPEGGEFVEGKDGPGRVRDPGTEDLGKPGDRSKENKPAPGDPGPSHQKGASAGGSIVIGPKKNAVSVSSKHTVGNPKGLVTEGNIDIHARPRVINKDCSVSTVRSITIEDDSGAVLLPTVGPDPKTGQPTVLSNDDAIAHYQKTGQHLGIFKTEDQANAYGEKLHQKTGKAVEIKHAQAKVDAVNEKLKTAK